MRPEFTGYDVAAAYIYRTSQATIRRWMRRLTDAGQAPPADPEEPDRFEVGSSAWALAPSRRPRRVDPAPQPASLLECRLLGGPRRGSRSPRFLWRLPHRRTDRHRRRFQSASWLRDDEQRREHGGVYALQLDPERADHYLFDGVSIPIRRDPITVSYRDGDSQAFVTRDRMTTHVGPMLHPRPAAGLRAPRR